MKLGLLQVIFLTSLILFGCASKNPADNPAPLIIQPGEIQTVQKEPWRIEWENTLSLARREGRLVLVTTNSPIVRQALTEGFKKATGLDVDIITGRGGEVAAKLIAEQRYGLYLSDVYVGGATTIFGSLKPAGLLADLRPALLLPEVLDPNAWYKKELPWLDNERSFILFTLGAPSGEREIAFNKNLIKLEQATSYYDLLQPKFKGKMSLQDPTTAGKGNTWFWSALENGMDLSYMQAIVKQEPFVTRNERLQIEWLVMGKHMIAISPDGATLEEFMKVGAPLGSSKFKETKPRFAASSGAISWLKNAPHPNAAKVFINWYLNKEGQEAIGRSYVRHSLRLDVPTDYLSPDAIRQPGLDYILDREDALLRKDAAIETASKIFGQLIR